MANAVKNDLCDLSNHLLSHGLITEANHEEFINDRNSPSKRASDLIRTVLERIKSDVRHYTVFVGVLEENELYYESVLQKIRSHDEGIVVISQPPLPPMSRAAAREHSDSESSPFIQTPYYVRYEDECNAPRKKPSLIKECYDWLMSYLCDFSWWLACSYLVLTPSFYLFTILVVFNIYHNSGCHNALYLIALYIIGMVTCILFAVHFFMLIESLDMIVYHRDMKKLSCSKQTILLHITPWLFILLLWFFALTHTCTT